MPGPRGRETWPKTPSLLRKVGGGGSWECLSVSPRASRPCGDTLQAGAAPLRRLCPRRALRARWDDTHATEGSLTTSILPCWGIRLVGHPIDRGGRRHLCFTPCLCFWGPSLPVVPGAARPMSCAEGLSCLVGVGICRAVGLSRPEGRAASPPWRRVQSEGPLRHSPKANPTVPPPRQPGQKGSVHHRWQPKTYQTFRL